MMSFSVFGGDVDLDGDGDIDVDIDSGVSIFTMKSITAFFAVGSWAGLLTCTLASDSLQWLGAVVAVVAGAIAMVSVAFILRAMLKMQCNGAVQVDKLVGKTATVYVSVPPTRGGRGKITLNAQGRYMEIDAVTDGEERLQVNEVVEIVSTENECTVVKRVEKK
jgi:membrane protein implicated in regulation of membrane protease activity